LLEITGTEIFIIITALAWAVFEIFVLAKKKRTLSGGIWNLAKWFSITTNATGFLCGHWFQHESIEPGMPSFFGVIVILFNLLFLGYEIYLYSKTKNTISIKIWNKYKMSMPILFVVHFVLGYVFW